MIVAARGVLAGVVLLAGVGCGGAESRDAGAGAGGGAGTDRPAPTIDARHVPERVRADGFEAFLRTLLRCMQDRGYHPRAVDDPAFESDGPGVNVVYGDGEMDDPDFDEAHAVCTAEGQAAERAAYRAAEETRR